MGASTSIGATSAGHDPLSNQSTTLLAARRPSSAQMSAVSAGCTRLPMANTPGVDDWYSRADRRREGARGHRQTGAASELVVGDPVTGEHHGVARQPAAVRQHDRLDTMASDDLGHGHIGDDRHPVPRRRRQPQRRHRLMPWQRRDHGDRRASAVPHGPDRREADVLGADDHTTTTDRAVVQRGQLLDRSGGEDARRPIAGHQPGSAWPLADTGCQHQRVGRQA